MSIKLKCFERRWSVDSLNVGGSEVEIGLRRSREEAQVGKEYFYPLRSAKQT